GALALTHYGFAMPWLAGSAMIALTFALCVCACRTTGETDNTPVGPLGQIAQLSCASIVPHNVVANAATAGVVGNASAAAADMLTNLKCGYLLGAEPRRQVIAQLVGCAVGAAVIVPLFYVLVPNPAALGTESFPAPAAQMVARMARVLAAGLATLPPSARMGLV